MERRIYIFPPENINKHCVLRGVLKCVMVMIKSTLSLALKKKYILCVHCHIGIRNSYKRTAAFNYSFHFILFYFRYDSWCMLSSLNKFNTRDSFKLDYYPVLFAYFFSHHATFTFSIRFFFTLIRLQTIQYHFYISIPCRFFYYASAMNSKSYVYVDGEVLTKSTYTLFCIMAEKILEFSHSV